VGAACAAGPEGAVMGTVVLLVLSAALIVYLLVALLSPERF
jgi:K+-transporting ATPase KdpF subunit